MRHWPINHQFKHMPITFRTELHSEIIPQYSFELFTPETIKLLGSTEGKITKDTNGGNVPQLKITEVVLVYCNIVNNQCQHYSRVMSTCLVGHLTS